MTTATQTKAKSPEEVEESRQIESRRPVWETVVGIGAQISDEEWEKVPDNSSLNYKKHLYGAPAKDR